MGIVTPECGTRQDPIRTVTCSTVTQHFHLLIHAIRILGPTRWLLSLHAFTHTYIDFFIFRIVVPNNAATQHVLISKLCHRIATHNQGTDTSRRLAAISKFPTKIVTTSKTATENALLKEWGSTFFWTGTLLIRLLLVTDCLLC